jgi:hypothetical protein
MCCSHMPDFFCSDIMSVEWIYIMVGAINSFFFISVSYPMIWLYHNLSVDSFIDGHLFPVLAMVSNATK